MLTFKIKVTDRRGKFPAKVYEVQAEQELFAYVPATERFIAENGIKPRGKAQRISSYYSRFWNEVVKEN